MGMVRLTPVKLLFAWVVTHIRVGIFVDGKGTTGVFDEKVQQPRLGQRVGQMAGHLFGYQMESACAGLQGKFYLAYHEIKKLLLRNSSYKNCSVSRIQE